MPRPDWLWLAIGIAVGLVIHQCLTHPKSPLSGYGDFANYL